MIYIKEPIFYRICPKCGVLIDCAAVMNGRLRISCACGYVGSFTNQAFDILPILVDSNEQKNEHVINYFDINNIAWKKKRLNVGDYMIDGDLSVSIDKKYGLDEIAGNMTCDYTRFRKELIRAVEAQTHLIVLIEEPFITETAQVNDWISWRKKEWDECKRFNDLFRMRQLHLNPKYPPICGSDLMRRMVTIGDKYTVQWMFTPKAECGRRIVEILGGEYGSKD